LIWINTVRQQEETASQLQMEHDVLIAGILTHAGFVTRFQGQVLPATG